MINIVIGSTDYLPGHAEQVQINCINDPNEMPNKMTFSPALRFRHNASVYSLSKVPAGQLPTGWTSVDTRAPVALLTRSIRIVSDDDAIGTPVSKAANATDKPLPPRDTGLAATW